MARKVIMSREQALRFFIEQLLDHGSVDDTELSRLRMIPNWTGVQGIAAYEALTNYREELIGLGLNLDNVSPPSAHGRNPDTAYRVSVIDSYLVVEVPPTEGMMLMELQAIPMFTYYHESRGGIPGPACVYPITKETVTFVSDFLDRQKKNGLVFTGGPKAHQIISAARDGSLSLNGEGGSVTGFVGSIGFEDSMFYMVYPSSDSLTEKVRQLPGRIWVGGRDRFFPLGHVVGALRKFAKKENFHISAEALEMMDQVMEWAKTNVAMSDATKPRTDKEYSAAKELYIYQRAGVEWLIRNPRTFLGDDMGTGKTIMCLVALEEQNAFPAVIVAPASVKYNWALEAQKWIPNRTVQVLDGLGDVVEDADITILNYDILINRMVGLNEALPMHPEVAKAVLHLRKFKKVKVADEAAILAREKGFTNTEISEGQLLVVEQLLNVRRPKGTVFIDKDSNIVVDIKHDMPSVYVDSLRAREPMAVVFDESHYLRHNTSKRSKNSDDLVNGHERYKRGTQWVRKSKQRQVPIVYMASGTQIKKAAKELLHPLKIMDRLGWFGGWNGFVDRYCDRKSTPFQQNNIDGNSNSLGLHSVLGSTGLMLRRTKAEVLPHLPPKTWSTLPVQINNRAEYEKTRQDAAQWFADRAIQEAEFLDSIAHLSGLARQTAISKRERDAKYRALRAKDLARISALRQVAAKGKVKAAIQWVNNTLAQGEKVIVFYYHTDVGTPIIEHFNALRIDGGVPTKGGKRQEIEELFNTSPDHNVLCIQYKAGREGLNLQGACHGLFVEMDWTFSDMSQAIDRMHRAGQKRPVWGWILAGIDTQDEDMLGLLDASEEGAGMILDGKHDGRDFQEELRQKMLKEGAYSG